MIPASLLTGLVGSVITLGIFVAGLIYNAGKLMSRIEGLEKWREGIRVDMHEISDKIGEMTLELSKLSTLIEERTERRLVERK